MVDLSLQYWMGDSEKVAIKTSWFTVLDQNFYDKVASLLSLHVEIFQQCDKLKLLHHMLKIWIISNLQLVSSNSNKNIHR